MTKKQWKLTLRFMQIALRTFYVMAHVDGNLQLQNDLALELRTPEDKKQ